MTSSLLEALYGMSQSKSDQEVSPSKLESFPKFLTTSKKIIVNLPYALVSTNKYLNQTSIQQLLHSVNEDFQRQTSHKKITDIRKIIALESVNKMECLDVYMTVASKYNFSSVT